MKEDREALIKLCEEVLSRPQVGGRGPDDYYDIILTPDEKLLCNFATALISRLKAEQKGYKLVPVEPTIEMQEAGCDAVDAYAQEIAPCSAFKAIAAYKAMLNAAPEVDKGE